MSEPSVIHYCYTRDSLDDISPTAFEAELHDALRAAFPSTLIDITEGGGRTWAVDKGGADFTPAVKEIAEKVFASLCG